MNSKLAKISSVLVATGVTFTGFVSQVLAADPTTWFPTQGTSGELPSLVTTLLNFAIGAGALAAVAMLIFAGFMYITANGDETKIGKATKTLTFAIVGLVVCFIAVMLVNFVLTTFLNK